MFFRIILLLTVSSCFAQTKTVSDGVISVVSGQKMRFKNLKLDSTEVVFRNIETNSDFTYLLNSVRTIIGRNGDTIYKQVYKPITAVAKKQPWLMLDAQALDSKTIRSEIIFTDGDTIRARLDVSTNLFDRTMINELSLTTRLVEIDDDVKKKYYPQQIRKLTIMDLKGSLRTFVPNGTELVELLYDGMIKWYRRYYSTSSGNVSSSDFMVNGTGQGVGLSYAVNSKKNLKKITSLRPDLIPFIDGMKLTEQSILRLLKKYDEPAERSTR